MSASKAKAAKGPPKALPVMDAVELEVWVSFATAALAAAGAHPDVARVAALADAMIFQYRKRGPL